VQQLTVAHTFAAQEEHTDALQAFEALQGAFGNTVHGLVQVSLAEPIRSLDTAAKMKTLRRRLGGRPMQRGIVRSAMQQPDAAVQFFEQARALDPNSLESGTAHAAALLALQRKTSDPSLPARLSQLSQQLLSADPGLAAPWVASSYFCAASAASLLAQHAKEPAPAKAVAAAAQLAKAISYAERAVRVVF
jgi:tetratricopeptide (TPR) repeat protein